MTDKTLFQISNPSHFIALGFGSGLLKPAPGTWGTLAAVPVYCLLVSLSSHLLIYAAIVVVALLLGIFVCGKAATDVGVHDHGAIVWDEFVGLWITLFAVNPSLINIVLGFALFRFFDILKPWPIKVIDQSVHGGLGIMLDDVLAGVMACLVLHGILLLS